MTGALIAPVESSGTALTGMSLPDSIQGLTAAIRSEGWVDDLLAGGSLAVETVSIALGKILDEGVEVIVGYHILKCLAACGIPEAKGEGGHFG